MVAFFVLLICGTQGVWTMCAKSIARRSDPRRVHLGRHTGGRRVAFPNGEILPGYMRYADGVHTIPYPTTEVDSVRMPLAHAPFLLHTRTSSREMETNRNELAPPIVREPYPVDELIISSGSYQPTFLFSKTLLGSCTINTNGAFNSVQTMIHNKVRISNRNQIHKNP